MKKGLKIVSIILAAIMMLSLCSCDETSDAENKQQAATDKSLSQMNNQLGMPNITNFTEKKLLKHIYELRDKSNLICYAYTLNQYDGKLVYQGKCLGYGLPYSTEYTNPQKATYSGSTGLATLPQADPNGLYAPSAAQATWLIMLDDKGNESVEYCEPDIIVSQSKKDKRLCEAWSLPTGY